MIGASAGIPTYGAMKESGVEWLGRVPAHWEVAALRHRYDQQLGKMLDAKRISGEHLRPYLRNIDVQWDRVNVSDLPRMDISPRESARYTLEAGDLLVCEGGEVGRSAIWTGNIEVCGYQKALHRLRPHHKGRDIPRYLLYSLKVATSRGAFTDGQKSTIDHLTGEKLRRHRFAFPPAPEQTTIVRFLDHVDARIRPAIREKEKLLELLDEHRQAVIEKAVTGQVDVRAGRPYPAYKDSGVEWLSRMPTHWRVTKLRQCVAILGGMTPSMNVRRFWGGEIPWVTPKDMKAAVVASSKMGVTGEAVAETSLRLIDAPAVLMVVRGMILARKVPIARTVEPVTINQDMKALVCGPEISADYLAAYLACAHNGLFPLIDEAGHGTRRLPTERWRELATAVPPVPEQSAITRYVDRVTADTAAAKDRADRQIALLREYHTRLIADIVTGKVDVREAAAALTDVDSLDTVGSNGAAAGSA